MKKLFGYFLSFTLMINLAILLIFNIFSLSISKPTLLYYLNNSNYYDKVKIEIDNKIKDYVYEEDLKKDYSQYFSKTIIKNDINKLLNNGNINHIENLKEIVSIYTSDKEIIDSYSSNINNIYIENLFPISTYNYLQNFSFKIDKILIIDILLLISIILTITYLFLLKYEEFYIKNSFMSLSFFLLFIHFFTKLIYYKVNINNIYLSFLLEMNLNIYLIIGLLIISIMLISKKTYN